MAVAQDGRSSFADRWCRYGRCGREPAVGYRLEVDEEVQAKRGDVHVDADGRVGRWQHYCPDSHADSVQAPMTASVEEVPLWVCDYCGGPAVWTTFDDVVYFHCESRCQRFMQSELFIPEGVEVSVRGHGADGFARAPTIVDEVGDLPF